MTRYLVFLLLLLLAACGPATDISRISPPDYVDTGIDPESWVVVPAGEFPSGQNDHMIDIDYDYQIMITNVTNEQYARYLNGAVTDGLNDIGDVEVIENENTTIIYGVYGPYPGDPFDGYKHEDRIEAGDKLHYPLNNIGERINITNQMFSSISELRNHPVTMVSWFGAEAYCAYYGWRLPTELEWEKAARGTTLTDEHGLAFPWGMEIESSHANYYSSHDLFEKILGKLGNTTPVGLYNGSSYDGYETLDQASPYGLYDMAGNVWQWTGDDYPKQHYRYLRGGSFYSYEVDLRIWKQNSAGPTFFAPDVGFRCAQD
ncbi:MAG: SUMF1/EgtB/PvdO family nonheme iron enzyme [Anaerolineales bacterium]